MFHFMKHVSLEKDSEEGPRSLGKWGYFFSTTPCLMVIFSPLIGYTFYFISLLNPRSINSEFVYFLTYHEPYSNALNTSERPFYKQLCPFAEPP